MRTSRLRSGRARLELPGRLTFLGLDFAYQHAVRDWLAVWGGVGTFARIGSKRAHAPRAGDVFDWATGSSAALVRSSSSVRTGGSLR